MQLFNGSHDRTVKVLIGTGRSAVCWMDHKITPFDNWYRRNEGESRKSLLNKHLFKMEDYPSVLYNMSEKRRALPVSVFSTETTHVTNFTSPTSFSIRMEERKHSKVQSITPSDKRPTPRTSQSGIQRSEIVSRISCTNTPLRIIYSEVVRAE